jgi:hypothetical protein
MNMSTSSRVCQDNAGTAHPNQADTGPGFKRPSNSNHSVFQENLLQTTMPANPPLTGPVQPSTIRMVLRSLKSCEAGRLVSTASARLLLSAASVNFQDLRCRCCSSLPPSNTYESRGAMRTGSLATKNDRTPQLEAPCNIKAVASLPTSDLFPRPTRTPEATSSSLRLELLKSKISSRFG